MTINIPILFEEIQKMGLSITKFSKELNIPVDRIYQWKKGNGKPKADDAEKITNWLSNYKKVTLETNELNEPQVFCFQQLCRQIPTRRCISNVVMHPRII